MNLRFDHPAFLLLGLLAIPLVILGWRAMALTDNLRRFTSLALRALLLLALASMLAGPRLRRTHDQLTIIGLLDISGSVQRFADLPLIADQISPGQAAASQPNQLNPLSKRSNIEYLRQWFRQATKTKAADDRFGLVVFDGHAIAVSAPTRSQYNDDNLDTPIAQGTNIAEAVRLGLAMFPADTAKRLVLVTDGNETAGNVREAIKQAGGDIQLSINNLHAATTRQSAVPIDVLPIAYHVTDDVQIARVEAPPNALPGQTVTVRIILETASPITGRLTLLREGAAIDLNGNEPGVSRHLTLPSGQSVQLAQVVLGETPINRFQATFEPDDPSKDALPDNDRAEAFVATPSKGSVLVVDPKASQRENLLTQILNAADLPAQAIAPVQLPTDLLSLQNFDLIVLNNVAASSISTQQQELLSTYVNDLGGGLLMIGGENSFGAGGWNGTPVANLLPVNLDPVKELRLPTAALVLVLDKSGSMNNPVAGARASQQTIANEGAAQAIVSLRSNSLVGVIAFDTSTSVIVPLQPNANPQKLADKVRAIRADGGTNMPPALEEAFNMLKDAKVAKKRIVCMSDGHSMGVERLDDIARRLAAANIQLTTIAVGDDADEETMERIAKLGGGDYWAVRDPRKLPQVLIDSVQVINRPLLKEVPFVPRVLPTGSTLSAGMDRAPQLDGNVITSAREDPKVAMEMLHPDGEPLLAHWQAGLGRVAAFTSDLDGPWSRRWNDWPTAATFWTQLVRTIARPAMNQNAELNATIQDEKLNISFELTADSLSADDLSYDYMNVEGTVYQPDGTTVPVRLRQNSAGRYEASIDAPMAGNYIVALNPRRGARSMAPVIGGANRATGAEFRKFKSNLGLLQEIVEATHGRQLNITNPTAINLFDRANVPPSISMLPMWRTVLIWTLIILLLDVACRRIAWDYNLLRSVLRRAVERVTPAHFHGNRAAATLATLRKVGDQIEARQDADAGGVQKFQATGIVAPPPSREVPPLATSATERADESTKTLRPARQQDPAQVEAALDALLGRTSTKSKPQSPVKPEVTHKPAETTGNLLAAKRRAQRQIENGNQDVDSDSTK